MIDPISFFVPGPPQGKARPRFGNGRTYTDKATVDTEKAVRWYARRAFGKTPPFEGPLKVTITARFERPKSWSKSRGDGVFWKTSRPDIDNCIKLIMDSVNPIKDKKTGTYDYLAWRDDAQVVVLVASKCYVEVDQEEGVTVTIQPAL